MDLIEKIADEVPQANMSNVNIAGSFYGLKLHVEHNITEIFPGSSNGAAMIYQLLIDTDKDRPFQR